MRFLLALLALPAASSLLLAPRTSCVARRALPHMASKKSKGKAGKPARSSAGGGFGAAPPKAQPFDLKRAMLRAMEPFAELRAADRSETRELSLDVYVKATGEPRFWFVGKAVGSRSAGGGASSDCDATNAVLLQKRLVLEHAKRLQRELNGAKDGLQLWVAPANSEVAVAQRKQRLSCLDGMGPSEGLSAAEVRIGFNPEQYDAEAVRSGSTRGFYVVLPDDGIPLEGTEVETRFVSPDELKDLELKGALEGATILDDAASVDEVADEVAEGGGG